MKTKKIFTDRLLKFAKHLETIKNHPEHGLYKEAELIALAVKARIHYKVVYHPWVFEELPAIFDEWYFAEKYGEPLFEGCTIEEGTVTAVVDFFDLTLDEFNHLFDVEGLQLPERFGGQHLTFESDGPALAHNIYELVKIKNADNQA